MRLYFATGQMKLAEALLAYTSGARHILMSYADINEVRSPSFTLNTAFWLDRDRQDAMRRYHAGSAGCEGGMLEHQLFLSGCRNRLVSYYDTPSSQARTDGRGGPRGGLAERFWIELGEPERREAVKLFVAGNGRQADSDKIDYETGTRNRLLSYAFVDDWADLAFEFWVDGRPSHASVFLDSGAFSAMSRGTPIDLDRYCDYIAEHKDALSCYAALDVIKDWKATARNVETMMSRGLDPIPTFHRGSPWAELDRLCREHKFIALGGMVGTGGKHDTLTPDSAGPYLDECFARIGRHWPVKVHLFGVVAQWALERYPLYSADSSSAIMGAGMGRVSRFANGQFRSRPWQEDARDTCDGVTMDGIGRTASGRSGSTSAHGGRRRRNIEAMLGLERYVTDLWARRGIVWED